MYCCSCCMFIILQPCNPSCGALSCLRCTRCTDFVVMDESFSLNTHFLYFITSLSLWETLGRTTAPCRAGRTNTHHCSLLRWETQWDVPLLPVALGELTRTAAPCRAGRLWDVPLLPVALGELTRTTAPCRAGKTNMYHAPRRVLPRIFLRRQAHPFHEYPSSPYLQSGFTEFVYCYGQ